MTGVLRRNATNVPRVEKVWRARRDCFGACGPSASLTLGSPPLRSGDRHRRCAALSSNSLVFCREFEVRVTHGSNRVAVFISIGGGAPGEIRTPDLLVRSQTLYPTELRAQTVTVRHGHAARRPPPF